MSYARTMALRITVFGVPFFAVVGLVFLLNSLEASPGVAVAAYAVIAIVTGATIGYFADRLLGGPPERPSGPASHLHPDR